MSKVTHGRASAEIAKVKRETRVRGWNMAGTKRGKGWNQETVREKQAVVVVLSQPRGVDKYRGGTGVIDVVPGSESVTNIRNFYGQCERSKVVA